MTTCVKEILNFGFKDLNLNRIVITVATDNQKSQAIPRSLGFTQEGIQRQSYQVRDEFKDIIVFSLLQSEFVD